MRGEILVAVMANHSAKLTSLKDKLLGMTGRVLTMDSDWKQGFAGHSFEELAKVAKKSLLSVDGDEVSEILSEFGKACKAMRADTEKFQTKVDDPDLLAFEGLHRRGTIMEKEAMIFTAIASMGEEPMKLRKILLQIKKEPSHVFGGPGLSRMLDVGCSVWCSAVGGLSSLMANVLVACGILSVKRSGNLSPLLVGSESCFLPGAAQQGGSYACFGRCLARPRRRRGLRFRLCGLLAEAAQVIPESLHMQRVWPRIFRSNDGAPVGYGLHADAL